jgi:hypothetical protein
MELSVFSAHQTQLYYVANSDFSWYSVIVRRQISWNFWIKYFHLICHLILTKINCITLKIRSKADFKSKSQNIWQQTSLFSSTVMQMICVMEYLLSYSCMFQVEICSQLEICKSVCMFIVHTIMFGIKRWSVYPGIQVKSTKISYIGTLF